MPKRVIDFDAMWGSDKLAACAEWAQAEYAWLYGLADASGCFELTNLRVIWGRVAAVRRNLTIERLEQVFGEFHDKGLLFVWEHDGKRYGHWTGSDVPGRLPAPSWRMRLERLAPPVPKQLLAEYVARFARGRAASPGGGFFVGARDAERDGGRENLQVGDQGQRIFEISDLKSVNVKCANLESSSGDAQSLSSMARDEKRFEISDLKYSDLKCPDLESDVRGPLGHGSSRAESSEPTFSRETGGGRAACAAAGFSGDRTGIACHVARHALDDAGIKTEIKAGLEEAQAQDWGWNRNLKLNGNVEGKLEAAGHSSSSGRELQRDSGRLKADATTGLPSRETNSFQTSLLDINSKSEAIRPELTRDQNSQDLRRDRNSAQQLFLNENSDVRAVRNHVTGGHNSRPGGNSFQTSSRCELSGLERIAETADRLVFRDEQEKESGVSDSHSHGRQAGNSSRQTAARYAAFGSRAREKDEIVARELVVGRGPCGPVHVKPEALERIRLRNAAREGSRSP